MLSFTIPAAATGLSAAIQPPRKLVLPSGAVAYEETAAGAWKWLVKWGAEAFFFSAAGVAALKTHIMSGGLLEGTLQRVVSA